MQGVVERVHGSILMSRLPALRALTCHDLIIRQMVPAQTRASGSAAPAQFPVMTCPDVLVDLLAMLLPDGHGVEPYRPYRELDLSWNVTYPHQLVMEFPLSLRLHPDPPHAVEMDVEPFSLTDARVTRRRHSTNPDLQHLVLNGRWMDIHFLVFILPRLTALQSITLKRCCHIDGQPWNPQQLEHLVLGLAPHVTVHV